MDYDEIFSFTCDLIREIEPNLSAQEVNDFALRTLQESNRRYCVAISQQIVKLLLEKPDYAELTRKEGFVRPVEVREREIRCPFKAN